MPTIEKRPQQFKRGRRIIFRLPDINIIPVVDKPECQPIFTGARQGADVKYNGR